MSLRNGRCLHRSTGSDRRRLTAHFDRFRFDSKLATFYTFVLALLENKDLVSFLLPILYLLTKVTVLKPILQRTKFHRFPDVRILREKVITLVGTYLSGDSYSFQVSMIISSAVS